MNELRRLLQEGDPVAREPGLAAADLERMRHTIMRMRAALAAPPRSWHGLLVVAAAGTVLIAGITLAQRAILLQPISAPPTDRQQTVMAEAHAPSEVRQLQFVTRGGTRVIWTFDSNFDMETR